MPKLFHAETNLKHGLVKLSNQADLACHESLKIFRAQSEEEDSADATPLVLTQGRRPTLPHQRYGLQANASFSTSLRVWVESRGSFGREGGRNWAGQPREGVSLGYGH